MGRAAIISRTKFPAGTSSTAKRIGAAAACIFFLCALAPRQALPANPLEGDRVSVSKSGAFVMHYPERLSKPAREIERLLEESAPGIAQGLGLEKIAPIQVYLASDKTAYARLHGGRIPDWGVAFSELGRRLLGVNVDLMSRDPQSFASVARHELSHLLLSQRVGDVSIPTWFMEGLAMVQAHEWGLPEEWRFMLMVGKRDVPYLEELRGPFPRPAEDAALSYSLSYVAVAELLRDRPDAVITLTAFIRDTGDFESAFMSTFGISTYDFAAKLYVSVYERYKVPGTLLNAAPYWVAFALLFVAVYVIKMTRNRRKLERWEEEETRQSRFWY